MKIQYKNGLLYVSLEVIYKGKRKIIDDVIIDTGAVHTIISPDGPATVSDPRKKVEVCK